MSDQYFYLTTTLPYVNASPHIGFGLEITEADVIARYMMMKLGERNVFFNTGTDEHGQKIYQKAMEAKLDPQKYCDQYAAKFADLKKQLNLKYNHFIRTTEQHHVKAAQEFWRRCQKNADIYKKLYKIKYCVGCELEKTDSELLDGKCQLHPNRDLEIREEENYFFRFSKYQQALLDLYQQQPHFVKPVSKMKEIISFVKQGLQDFSISRLKSKMPWGIPVPGDKEHVMYVWFDALINYISTIGWPDDTDSFRKYWPGLPESETLAPEKISCIQLAGKDNLRQQSAMWQAMLLSAGLPTTQQILINGFISIDGQKMSKSLGNVISPKQMVERYGTDATRYLLISLGAFSSDMDVNWDKFDNKYTADLTNGLGNLCSRVAKMCEKAGIGSVEAKIKLNANYEQAMTNFELNDALSETMLLISKEDQFLSEAKPWQLAGEDQALILANSATNILTIAHHLQPFMPETAQKILDHFNKKKIVALKALFPRLKQSK
ncbi:MAG: methionine--tRNA ligase [Candidatus Woesebacteria bacterium]|jgi:methionyl-tRNA synthetase